jgi:hypothetical protein
LQGLEEEAPRTGDSVIVEARADYVWGSGLSTAKTKSTPVRDWKGQNLLGEELMLLREYFQDQVKIEEAFEENNGEEGIEVEGGGGGWGRRRFADQRPRRRFRCWN